MEPKAFASATVGKNQMGVASKTFSMIWDRDLLEKLLTD